MESGVNALSGLYLISTTYYNYNVEKIDYSVNALSGLYLISTSAAEKKYSSEVSKCQCPLGLIPHFYMTPRNINYERYGCVNALSGLYLISTVSLQKPRFYAVSRACFCRYLSEYSDNSCFSCMLTIWTYLTRYTCL